MITLSVPRVNENQMVIILGAGYGPYGPNGTYIGDSVAFNSTLRSLDQHRGIYGENSVEHQSITGDFKYHPFLGCATRSPTPDAPDRLSVPCKNWLGTPIVANVDRGFAVSGKVSVTNYTTGHLTYQDAHYYNPATGKWSVYEVTAYTTSITRATYLTRFEAIELIGPLAGGKMSYQYHRTFVAYTSPGFPQDKHDWSQRQSWDTIVDLVKRGCPEGTSFTGLNGNVYQVTNPGSVPSPRSAKEQIDLLIGSIVPEETPIKDYPYGDLAMRALNQVDANHTNMIAFLKDLRHPTDLIPKLRNLRSLKAWAGRYLGVKYGILPTVSDLQTIVKAFQARAPFLDKNGFRTYSAGETTVSNTAYYSCELKQYLKIALDNEDSEFKLLLERLENMGLFPNLVNIWDLVPYSFAVDWFVDVGELLKRVDTNLRLQRLNIRYVTMSRKTVIHGSCSGESLDSPFIGTFDWTKYHRWVSDQCPGPTLSLKQPSQPFNHWLEAGALLIQRL